MSIPLIIMDFQFLRDFRKIKWGATIQFNLLRAFCAGMVLSVLMFFVPGPNLAENTMANTIGMVLATPFVWSLAYLFVFLPIGILFSLLFWIPFLGLISCILAFCFCSIGDPIVCILHKINPKLVSMEDPPIFSLTIVIWLLDTADIAIAE